MYGTTGLPFTFSLHQEQVGKYLKIAKAAVNGYMTIATFSVNGPEKCSGLPIKQYDEQQLIRELQSGFTKVRGILKIM